MIDVGKFNKLVVKSKIAYGYTLDGAELGDILLLNKQAKDGLTAGDNVQVFVYMDSDDKIMATMKTPRAQVGQFAFLKVVSVNRVGAFLDNGSVKDILVRYAEQSIRMQEERFYVVYIFREDESLRIAASSKLDHYFNFDISHYEIGEEVDILIWQQTDIGYKAIINNTDLGLLYQTEIFQSPAIGQRTKAYVKKVRDDLKIDLVLEKPGYEKPDALTNKIVELLTTEGGFLPINDKSPAPKIAQLFGVSKKKFKMALGGLYKNRKIEITKEGIRLIKKKDAC